MPAAGMCIEHISMRAARTMFEVTSSSNRARTGVFASLPTPTFFVHSRRGSPAHLTPDNATLAVGAAAAYQASLTDVLVPAPAAYERAGGARSFFNLGAHSLFLTQRDAADNRAFSGGDAGIAVSSKKGMTVVGPAAFVRLNDAMRADFVQLLGDEVECVATANRCRKSAERTLKWANEQLRLLAASTASPRPVAIFMPIQGGGSVPARTWLAQQAAAVQAVHAFAIGGLGLNEAPALRESILDAVLAHLPANKARFVHGCGQPDRALDAIARGVDLFDGGFPALVTESHCALVFPIDPFDEAQVQASRDAVTAESLLMPSATSLTPASSAASAGARSDGAESHAAERPSKRVKLSGGAAATAPTVVDAQQSASVAESASASASPSVDTASSASTACTTAAKPTNRPTPHVAAPPRVRGAPAYVARLACPSYRRDARPLLPGCTCHACTQHTRAYIQHLCVTQEMTAHVLLQIHNLHHYTRFFAEVRRHVAAGSFDAYRERMFEFVGASVLISEHAAPDAHQQ